MDTEQFDKRIEATIADKPNWFSEVEAPTTDDDAYAVERILGATLPPSYKHFATTFGAGYFGSINVSSLDSDSEWFRANSLLTCPDGQKFYVLSDDHTGGFYGFVVEGDRCNDAVVYVHPDDGGEIEIVAQSFFDFVVEHGLP